MVDWRWTGYNALIFLAAMQAIPRDLYEAAEIDGAGRLRQFVSVTLPLLRPTLIFTSIISIIGGVQLFTEPLLLNAGSGGDHGRLPAPVADADDVHGRESASTASSSGTPPRSPGCVFLMILVVALVNIWLVRRIRSAD